MVTVEIGHQSGDVHWMQCHRADRHGASNDVGHLVDGVLRGTDCGQRGPGVGQQCRAGFGQPHLATGPREQLLADHALQASDLRAHRGLRHPFALRSPGEAALFHDGDQIFELTQLHNDRL